MTDKVPAPVKNHTDAMRILLLAASHPLQAETLAFILDERGNGGVITIISGTNDADSILPVVECMVKAAERVDGAAALVVATVRPGGCVLPGDLDRWMEAHNIADEHGIGLIEWFIITEEAIAMPRALIGESPRWNRLDA